MNCYKWTPPKISWNYCKCSPNGGLIMLLLLLLLFLNANVLINVTTIPSNVDKSSTSLLSKNWRFRTLLNPPPSKLIVPINDSMELKLMKRNDPELCPPMTPSTCASTMNLFAMLDHHRGLFLLLLLLMTLLNNNVIMILKVAKYWTLLSVHLWGGERCQLPVVIDSILEWRCTYIHNCRIRMLTHWHL